MSDKFEAIAKRAILDAQGVACSVQDCVEGLRLIIDKLRDELTRLDYKGEKERVS